MFHSSIFTMASNITPDEDEPMHLAGLDMTRGSLKTFWTERTLTYPLHCQLFHWMQPICSSIQIKLELTSFQIKNLGPLSTLKITDADLIIRNLNNELNTAAKKNDTSTALLQRMDQHQKQIEAQVAELKAGTKQLAEEKEAAIREKCNYTINQERLVENIRHDLEREYTDKEQNYLKQLKDEMRAICNQYKTKLNQEIEKLKAEWTQECLKN